MARDYLSIGPTPCEEDCEQLGPNYSSARARGAECRAFANQLVRAFGEPPEGARIGIKSNPHDFGSYLEVVVHYDTDNEAAADYAFDVENNHPCRWDDEARADLATKGIVPATY